MHTFCEKSSIFNRTVLYEGVSADDYPLLKLSIIL